MLDIRVGDQAWYFPPGVQSGTAPLAAMVAYVWNPHLVNLSIWQANGLPLSPLPTSVRLLQEDDPIPPEGNYAILTPGAVQGYLGLQDETYDPQRDLHQLQAHVGVPFRIQTPDRRVVIVQPAKIGEPRPPLLHVAGRPATGTVVHPPQHDPRRQAPPAPKPSAPLRHGDPPKDVSDR
jgi:hypothetical protein